MKSNQDLLLQIKEIIQIQQQSKLKTLYISEYIPKKQQCGIDSEFLIICIENMLIIIEETELKNFYSFFLENQNSTFYSLDDNIKFKIEKILNLQLNFSNEIDIKILKTEILSLASQFKVKMREHENKNRMKIFYKMIFDAISGYLITKSHKKSIETDHFANFFKRKNEIKIENQNEYVELGYFSNGNKNNIVLIYHIESENLYILKLFVGEDSDKLFKREVNNYMKIQHYFFPQFFCSKQYNSDKCIVIEYIAGQTLDKVDMRNLEMEKKIKIMFQIMIAIEFIHNNGFIYRDLKPNNILMNKNGSIKIIDFDRMCKEDDDYLFTKDFQHYFIAPEITEGKKPTKKADVYSIGKMIEYIFLDEYILLKELSDRCTSDESERPLISEVIDTFYYEFVSQISVIDETDTIQNNNIYIHSIDFFWFNLAENKHPIAQYLLSVFHYKNNDNKRIQYLTLSADQNYAPAQLCLGNIYYKNNLSQETINKCIHYFTLAANQNQPEALFKLGEIYLNNKFIPQDINKGMCYTLATNLTYVDTEYDLNIIYDSGKYVSVNKNKSIYYFKLSADQNYRKSQFYLGLYYYTHNDINKAIHYFTLAANQNQPEALFKLGKIYSSNKFIPRDIDKAIYYYTLAANLNYADAQYELGVIYDSGKYVSVNKNKSIYYFKLAADQNNENAQFDLGLCYYEQNDIKKAIHYFTLASEQNHVKADEFLGIIYSNSKYVQFDINKAIHYFKLAADKNSSTAQYKLGLIYFDELYIPQDLEKAIYYLTLAANSNNLKALNALGLVYLSNESIVNNIDKAIHYLTIAANLNNPKAQCNLGEIYYSDKYKRKDIQKSIHYYTLAANLNHPIAQYNIGILYFYGKYFKQDINKATHYFKLAAQQNLPNALFFLGIIYSYYTNPRDIDKSIYYLKLAANLNDASAQFALGLIYDNAEFVPRDMNKAIHYYLLAANQNEPRALFKIGLFYYFGEYKFKKDINKSIQYLTISANKNNCDAQFFLGMFYKKGEIVPRDTKKAINLLTLSANNNHHVAQYKLGKIYLKGKIVEQDINKALYYLSYSAKANNKNSQYYLGKIYLENKYVERDIEKSIHYLQLASDNHMTQASFELGCIYMKGFDNISKDIDKSIHYFKEGSSFDCNFAKNNLGVIYKIIKNNPAASTEYFQEAIIKKNDFIAMYNLGQLLFYGQSCDSDIDKSIELLIKPSNKMFKPAVILLCLAIMKKIPCFSIENISKETKKHGNKNKYLDFYIYQTILNERIDNELAYGELYSFFENRYFIYYYLNGCHFKEYYTFMENDSKKSVKNEKDKNVQTDISDIFYEGFGHDLL